ncbi:MAG: hypothetical protein IKB16_08910, partial [Lentisphaeria bacterium]|nr:hypothetical protein [Lentisphaeria bacterium]
PAGKYQLRGNIKGKVESIYLVVNRPQGGVKPPNAFISTKFAGSAQNWSNFVLTFDVPVAQDRAGMTLQANVPGANDPVTFRKLQVIRIGDASVNPVVSAAPKAKAPAVAKAKTAVRNVVAPKVEISGKLVARPAAASNVSWPVKLTVTRRRLRSVLQGMIYVGCKIVSHAKSICIKFGCDCPWFNCIKDVYARC